MDAHNFLSAMRMLGERVDTEDVAVIARTYDDKHWHVSLSVLGSVVELTPEDARKIADQLHDTADWIEGQW